MSNQTLPKPTAKRRGGSNAAAGTAPRRQTARLEGRRDGKPLIFGWGAHLTRHQKTALKERAAWLFAGVIIVLVVAVFVFGVIQQTAIIPNQRIVRVGGAAIPQDRYRKQLAYDAQTLWNRIQNQYTQLSQLATKISSGDRDATNKGQALASNIQADEGNYSQSTITTTTINELIEDQLIQQGIQSQFKQDAAKLTPSSAAVDAGLKTFKASFPPNQKYSDFLSKNNLTESDVRGAVAVQVRRDMMQKYLADRLVSPAKQVHLRKLVANSAADAQKLRDQLMKDSSDQKWSALAKQSSLDPGTKDVGGDMGWVFAGAGDAVIERWAYGSNTKVNDISPVLADVAGTFDVVQLMGVDDNRAIAADQLSQAKTNALADWLAGLKHLTANVVGAPNQDMLGAGRNLPHQPDLNATLPNVQPSPNPIPPAGG